ncbi:unnamed protein product [Linum tenue]|uniref:Reverse transcriptase zinc-binding domain-containing protein n=1 Tax=Linum tenue TaxID=586396 RepID=A0AAV0H0Q8_9ROSI|nr:unnamed protein product [Linum tenue]
MGDWDWPKLQVLFQPDILALIAGTEPPKEDLGEDKCIWGLERDGRFRLKSAYKLAADQLDATEDDLWKNLWKWPGHSRTKHFFWLVLHDRLLTNKERLKRKLTTDGTCRHCKDAEETTEHIVRSCSKTKSIWGKFRSRVTCKDETLPFKTWMARNLNNAVHGVEFGLIVWHLWKQRNEECLDGKIFVKKSLVCRIEAWFRIYIMAQQNVEKSFDPPVERREEQIGWNPLPEGWVQIQTDGSVLSPSGKAAAGGLIRDWDVVISHVYREGNRAADYLASLGHCLPFGTHHVDVCSPELCRWLELPYLQEKNPNIKCFLIDAPGFGLFNKVTSGVMHTKEEAEGKRLKNPFDTITEGIDRDQ